MDTTIPTTTQATYVAIDGIPGSGKTTTLDVLKQVFAGSSLVCIDDGKELRNSGEIFEMCGKDPKRWTFAKQVHAGNVIRKIHLDASASSFVLTVGVYGMTSVKVFDEFWLSTNNVQELEHTILKANHDTFNYLSILLEPSTTEMCLTRMKKRNTHNEFPYSKDNLHTLVDLYSKHLSPYAVVCFDGTKSHLSIAFQVFLHIIEILRKRVSPAEFAATGHLFFEKFVEMGLLKKIDNTVRNQDVIFNWKYVIFD